MCNPLIFTWTITIHPHPRSISACTRGDNQICLLKPRCFWLKDRQREHQLPEAHHMWPWTFPEIWSVCWRPTGWRWQPRGKCSKPPAEDVRPSMLMRPFLPQSLPAVLSGEAFDAYHMWSLTLDVSSCCIVAFFFETAFIVLIVTIEHLKYQLSVEFWIFSSHLFFKVLFLQQVFTLRVSPPIGGQLGSKFVFTWSLRKVGVGGLHFFSEMHHAMWWEVLVTVGFSRRQLICSLNSPVRWFNPQQIPLGSTKSAIVGEAREGTPCLH